MDINNSENTDKKLYNPAEIESKWQAIWEKNNVYQTDLETDKKKFYNLMMFPYPSAEGLHVGNVYTFGGIDAYGRFKRMQGYEVFEPIGLDGFGIHSENYAIKVGRTPQEHANISEDHFYKQLRMIGNSFDWSRKVETYKPEYYKWTQWLFTELFKAGLAYKAEASVNFCPSCKTVLSDEQVIDGKCERCSSVVEKRQLSQWFFRITDYAERLLANTEKLDWTEKVKIAQKNWIGKKTGINITYGVEGSDKKIVVFTTRPDTNFGATFIALAPENPLSIELATPENKQAVEEYIQQSTKKTDIERQAEGREKTGVFTGSYAVNQLNGYRMPIWVSDFVLSTFGTGALVGVPAHDRRDFEFAKKFDLAIKRVVIGSDNDESPITVIDQVQEEEGIMMNSEFLNGMDIHQATQKIMDYMEEEGWGERVVSYHLRDWLISRQRYWGPPIPMIYCESCAKEGKSWFTTDEGKDKQIHNSEFIIQNSKGWYPVPLEQLPVALPVVEDFKPLGTGKAPLANYPEFYETTCPGCGGKATRETDVSDTFLDSSWYFFRYLVTDLNSVPIPMEDAELQSFKVAEKEDGRGKMRAFGKGSPLVGEDGKLVEQRLAWLPVTSYIGGAEHAVLHLLYSRFITMVLKDLGYIDFEEPFAKFRANGLIIKDGAKMSKSKGNVINPDDYVRKFGADTLRTYLGFIGPFTQGGDFQDTGIEGISRFLNRVWKLVVSCQLSVVSMNKDAEAMMHKTIKVVTEDMEELRFNTAIAKLMTYYNFLVDQKEISREEIGVLLKLLAPFAPHMTEELWQRVQSSVDQSVSQQIVNQKTDIKEAEDQKLKTENWSIHTQSWPVFDVEKIVSDMVTIAVQVNGKLRETIETSISNIKSQKDVENIAKERENVKKYLGGKTIRKVIYVPGKILNFVIT